LPKTIDNYIVGTTKLFRLRYGGGLRDRRHRSPAHDRGSAQAHPGGRGDGRYAGWIALYAASPAAPSDPHPEIPFDIGIVTSGLAKRDRWGAKVQHRGCRREGAYPKGGTLTLVEAAHGRRRSGSAALGAQVCEALHGETGKETRSVVHSHCSAGSAPTSFDRVLATRFRQQGSGAGAARRVRHDGGVRAADIIARRIDDVVGRPERYRWTRIC